MQQEADRQRAFTRRTLLLGLGGVGLFGVIGTRLYGLQVRDGHDFALLAEDNRANERLLVPPRGRIFDRQGLEIAGNVPTYRVSVVREQVGDVAAILQRLATVIAIEPSRIAAVTADAVARRGFVPVPIREDLTWDEVARVAVHTPDLPGILLEAGLLRHYPHAELMAHVVGYVGPVNVEEQTADADPMLALPQFRIGKNGIEKVYEHRLRGRAGTTRVEVNAVGREIRELMRDEGDRGEDLTLGIDLELQAFCAQRLLAEKSACAVALDVATGGVLALASVPSFDPTPFTTTLSHGQWTAWRDDPLTPLVNKPIRGTYPPGSTFKMMVALAGLEGGEVGPDFRVTCVGYVSLGNARFHCWRKEGHGSLNMAQALEQSCDCYFYELARRIGIDPIAAMATRFGLGQPTGIDLVGEKPGLMPTRAWKKAVLGESWQKGETLVNGIGQGFVSATPLQLAMMTARIATGRAVTPWLIRGAEAAAAPSLDLAPASLEVVRRGMFNVVNGPRGTAGRSKLRLPGVAMAGKTGTSQVTRISKADRLSGAYKRRYVPWNRRDHALFVCFAPYDTPRYALAVIVEHGEGGSKAAAPIARDIMERLLQMDGGAAEAVSASFAPDRRS